MDLIQKKSGAAEEAIEDRLAWKQHARNSSLTDLPSLTRRVRLPKDLLKKLHAPGTLTTVSDSCATA
jgi:hypothetical protein